MKSRLPIAIFLVCVIPASALAQDDPEGTADVQLDEDEQEARAHFELAQLQFRRGRFLEAGAEFRRAYALSPRPELLYNAYLAFRDGGDLEQAASALRELLELDLTEAVDSRILRARLESLERELEERRALEARVAAQEAALAERETEPEPEAEASAPETTPAVTEPAGGTWAPGWAILGGGAALAVAGAITGGVALSLYGSVSDRCTDGVCPADTEGDRSTGQALTITTDVLLPVGVAAAALGLILALVIDDAPDAPVACGPAGCVGRF